MYRFEILLLMDSIQDDKIIEPFLIYTANLGKRKVFIHVSVTPVEPFSQASIFIQCRLKKKNYEIKFDVFESSFEMVKMIFIHIQIHYEDALNHSKSF